MTKFSYVWWILISKGQKVQDINISALISDFSKRPQTGQVSKMNSEETFQSRLKKIFWSFIILSLTSATAKANAKKNPKQEVARCNYETETWWVTFKWQKHTLLNEKKGVRHSLLWHLAKAQYLPLLRRKKERKRTVDTLMHQQRKTPWIKINIK